MSEVSLSAPTAAAPQRPAAGSRERELTLQVENASWRDVRVTSVTVLGETDLEGGPVRFGRVRPGADSELDVTLTQRCAFETPADEEISLRLQFDGGSSIVSFPRAFGYGCV